MFSHDPIREPNFIETRLLTVAQTASLLGCSEANIYGLLESGDLAYVLIGRRKGYRIDRADLEAFITSRKRKQAAAPVSAPRPRLKHIRLR